jgi:hypothetical protein
VFHTPSGYIHTVAHSSCDGSGNPTPATDSNCACTGTDDCGVCVNLPTDSSQDLTIDCGYVTPPAANCVTINAMQGVPITPVTLVASGGCGGPYTFVAVGLPNGLTMSSSGTISGTPSVSGTFSYTVTITDNCGNVGTINCSVTVGPNATGCTFTPGGWGAPPNGNNVATILYAMFPKVYPSGFVVGGTYTIKFTSASAITIYLPAGTTPGVLKKNYTNPTSPTTAGEFADQVIALKLNVDASNKGYTQAGLASLKVASGYPLAGTKVSDLLILANKVLGGNTSVLPAGITVPILTDLLSDVNGNFDNCGSNKGVLSF